MTREFRILQANLKKITMAQHSMLNDENLKDFGLLLIQEPHRFLDDTNKPVASPIGTNSFLLTM